MPLGFFNILYPLQDLGRYILILCIIIIRRSFRENWIFHRKTLAAEFRIKGLFPSSSQEFRRRPSIYWRISFGPRCKVVTAVHHSLSQCSEEAIREASAVFEDLWSGLRRLDVAWRSSLSDRRGGTQIATALVVVGRSLMDQFNVSGKKNPEELIFIMIWTRLVLNMNVLRVWNCLVQKYLLR